MNRKTVISLVAMLVIVASAAAGEMLSDPYEIYEKHFEAIGGLDRLKADSTLVIEADIGVFGLQGTLRTWTKSPIQERQEIDLGVFKETTGDNGEVMWTADANGKVQFGKDENALVRREIRKLAAVYDYLDRESSTFKLAYTGIEKVGETDCYVVKMTNSLNDDQTLIYFDTASLLTMRENEIQPDRSTDTRYSDFREVAGVLRSFHQEITMSPGNQEMSVQMTAYESNVSIDPALFEPPVEDAQDFRFLAGDRAENIPFEYMLDHIFVRLSVAGKERLWILDTGASLTVIDSAFAAELGLASEGEIKAQAVANVVSINFVKLPPFSMTGIEFDEQTAGALNFDRIMRRIGIKAAGILGYDFISRFVLKIDYAKKTLSLYDPQTFEYTGSGVVLDAPLFDNIMSVPITVDGKYTGRWDIDIGAGSCSFFYPFAKEHGFLERRGVESVAFGAGGGRKQRGVKFESLELAGFAIKEPVIAFPLDEVEGGFGATERIGNLGNEALRHFNVYFDYNKQQMIVEKGDDFDRKFPRGKSGLQVMYNDDGVLEVLFVSENTPAHKAGFKEGDVVLAINGINVEYLAGLEAVRNIMRGEVGTELAIRVMRDGKEKDIKLVLKEIY